MVGEILRARLSPTVKVYPQILPQSPTLPATTYTLLSMIRHHAFSIDAPVRSARVQLDCWASTYTGARQLANQVTELLNRFRGVTAGHMVWDITHDTEQELYEGATRIHRVMQDYTIHYEENEAD